MGTEEIDKPPPQGGGAEARGEGPAGRASRRATAAERASISCLWSLFVGSTVAVAFLVWPRFDPASEFQRFGLEVPAALRALSEAAAFVRTYWWIITPLYVAGLFWGATRAPRAALSWAEPAFIVATGAIAGFALMAIWMPRMQGP